MNLLRKALVPLAGVAVVALVISVAGPRTVRAITATLVQVTNTVPVIVAPSAPQLYESNCVGAFFGTAEAACSFQAVPAGNTLFIDGVSILLNTLEGGLAPQNAWIQTFNTGASYPEGQITAGGSPGVPLNIPLIKQASDIFQNYVGTFAATTVWTGSAPKCTVLLNGASQDGVTFCVIWGHLAPIQ